MSEEDKEEKKLVRGSRKWRRLRRVVQVLMLVLFLYLLVGTQQGNVTFLPSGFFFNLDPLAGISAMIASRSWIAPMAWGIVTLLLTVVVGRAWCSWICPLGTLLDWTPSRRPKRNKLDIPSYWRQVKYFVLFVILFAAMLGSLTLIVLDPITLLFRTITSVILPTFNSLVTEQPFFLPNVLLALLFVGVLALNAIRPRFWCRYLCPLGALLGLVSKFAQVRHKVNEEQCINCRRCAVICPTGAIDPERKFMADPEECTACLDCVEACPTGAITFRGQWGLDGDQSYDQSRRQFLISIGAAAGVAVIGVALSRVASFLRGINPFSVRPPGTNDEKLLDQCIRCGECIKVCPTAGLQPSFSSGGLEGLWTPVLISRLGYCDYSCNSCGQVCPTKAIPDLSLDEKRNAIMGKAYIDRDRCLPWAEGSNCRVCEEVCPVPQNAIRLDEQKTTNSQGGTTIVYLPRVRGRSCIGCGICEYWCPVEGESAIRVYTNSDSH